MNAEWSDKIPSGWAFLVICLVFVGTVSLFAARRWLWPMLLEFTIIGIGLFGILREFLLDAPMRQAILHEHGLTYYLVAFASLLIPVIVGIAVYVNQGRKTGQPADGQVS